MISRIVMRSDTTQNQRQSSTISAPQPTSGLVVPRLRALSDPSHDPAIVIWVVVDNKTGWNDSNTNPLKLEGIKTKKCRYVSPETAEPQTINVPRFPSQFAGQISGSPETVSAWQWWILSYITPI